MFDPTAFENMRVVMDGMFYDKDLSGEIVITDRNDLLNTAKLSRHYNLSFQLPFSGERKVTCTFHLSASLENLTAELLERSDFLAGCTVKIDFTMKGPLSESLYGKILDTLSFIWESGESKVTICSDSFMSMEKVLYTGTVTFNRLIYEEQIDDLTEMFAYMLLTLERLETLSL